MLLVIQLVSAALISNVVLSQFLGICPFLGVSNKVETAKGMGVAVIAVITIATIVTYALDQIFLEKTGIFGLDLTYLQTIVFILVIACLVQFLELVLKRFIPSLYKALGIFLPLITTNCAVLGVALNVVKKYNGRIMDGMAYSLGTSIGFCIAIVLLASIRERIADNDIPESFKGKPIVLVIACLLAIAFTGFSNIDIKLLEGLCR